MIGPGAHVRSSPGVVEDHIDDEAAAAHGATPAKSFMTLELPDGSRLTLQPQSRVYGMLCLLWGEIALRQKHYEQAIQRLIKPTYAIEDEQITPQALLKSAHAHEQLEQGQKAAELRVRLKEKFPAYRESPLSPKLPDTSKATASP